MAVSAEAVFDRVERLNQLMSELEPILQSVVMNDSVIIDGLAQMLATLQQMHARSDDRVNEVAQEVRDLAAQMTRWAAAAAPPAMEAASETDSFDLENPEIGLLAHLLPHLPNPVALDVGANVGRVAERLVLAGYEVFAFEPFAESFAALARRAEDEPRLHPHNLAIGPADGRGELHVAVDLSEAGSWDTSLYHSLTTHPMLTDLKFSGVQGVEIRSLASLIAQGAVPAEASVLKIDTEGADLDVIRGAGEARFAVVTAEFWDEDHPFGRGGHGALPTLTREMRARGYPWHIVIYRVDETETLGFHCNARSSVPKSWGNAVFFRDFAHYGRAVAWCERRLA